MKRLAIVLVTLLAVPALADPDPDDTTETAKPKKTKKKKKKKSKKDKERDKEKAAEDAKQAKSKEIEMDDPTAAPPPVNTTGAATSPTADGPTDPNAAATAVVVPAVLAGATPIELAKRPLVIQQGRLDVGAYVAVPRGPDYTSTTAGSPIGKWIGFHLRAEYGAIDKLAIGLDIALAPVTSDSLSTDTAASKFGGFVADAKYALIDGQRANQPDPLQLAAHVSLGMLKRGAPSLGPFTFPLFGPDLEPSFGLGVALQKTLLADKLALIVDPHFFFQASGHASFDTMTSMQVNDLLVTFELPINVMYQAAPNISVGGRTGIYTGQKLSFSPDENLAIPLVAEAVFTTLKNQLDIGVDLGLGNLTPRRGTGPVETFMLGIFATYRTK